MILAFNALSPVAKTRSLLFLPPKIGAHNAFYVQELLICLGAPMKPVASTSNRQTPICCR